MENFNGLSTDRIAKLAPAAVERGQDMTRTSGMYQPIHTMDAVKFLGEQGFRVTDASQMFARKKDNRYTRHLLTFLHEDADMNSDTVPRLLLLNSHNGTTALKLMAGMYRFVCANGLIVGETMAQTKIRHMGSPNDILNDQLEFVTGVVDRSQKLMDRWRKKELSTGAMEAFAQQALELRTNRSASVYDINEVLHARRDQDEGNDMWRVFNRVQENLVQGGVHGRNPKTDRVSTLRGLKDIRKNVEFNTALWNLAEEIAA